MMTPLVSFTLGAPTKTLNEIRAMHYRAYAKHRQALAFEVFALTIKQKPSEPLPRARIVVERHGERPVDPDNAIGGLKPLADVLQPFHVTLRPNGVGIIASDAPDFLTIEMRQVRCRRGEAKTIVQIFGV